MSDVGRIFDSVGSVRAQQRHKHLSFNMECCVHIYRRKIKTIKLTLFCVRHCFVAYFDNFSNGSKKTNESVNVNEKDG